MVSIGKTFVTALIASGAIFVSSPARADLEFSCTVEKSDDGVKYGPMGRRLMCPMTIQVSRDGTGSESTYATSCIIDVKDSSCRGVAVLPSDAKIIAVATTASLLRDEEVVTGAIPASKDMPYARLSEDKTSATVEHRYIFPIPHNFYHNSTKPCDINKDGRVSPLDMLALNEFRRKNGWNVNLMKYESKGEAVPAVDPTNDWWGDWKDERAVLNCLNGR